MKRTVLGLSERFLSEKGAHLTSREIAGQPDLWRKTYALAKEKAAALNTFLRTIFLQDNLKIILSGAGTSEFIGNCVEGIVKKNTGLDVQSIATTDIVTHPLHYFHETRPTLLISFSRSGGSPESLATVELADKLCRSIYHLVITCNAEGTLVKNFKRENALVIALPAESNDQGLAMTGSFTSMLLMAILISKLSQITMLGNDIEVLCGYGETMLHRYKDTLRTLCELPFERAVFLGSGPLTGCAQECHLKLQELTDGIIISKYDSFLGFRHGPKAVINAKTLMVYLFSSTPYVSQYEYDLLQAVEDGERGICSIGIMEVDTPRVRADVKIVLNDDKNGRLDSDFLPVCYVLAGQLLGFYKSLQLGLRPDAPSESGTITRVVQGVKLYPFIKC